MSNGFERESERAGDERSSASMMRLLGQMLMLPFTVFVYGMEVFVKTVKGMQHAADQGMDVMAGGTGPPQGSFGSEVGATDQTELEQVVPSPTPRQNVWSDLKVNTTTSTGDGADASQKETGHMVDRNLSDDQLKLVRYKVLFVKRDYEVAFQEREELVYDNMTAEAFTAWKVAEFIQRLPREKVPEIWKARNYPTGRTYTKEDRELDAKVYITSLTEDDKKYLRVYFEVLDRYVREAGDDEVDVLKEIRDAINHLPARGPAYEAGQVGKKG